MTFFASFPRNLSFFTSVFDPHTYKVTTTTAQITFYNFKLHFTTAEIVISYTLKYAPDPTTLRPPTNPACL